MFLELAKGFIWRRDGDILVKRSTSMYIEAEKMSEEELSHKGWDWLERIHEVRLFGTSARILQSDGEDEIDPILREYGLLEGNYEPCDIIGNLLCLNELTIRGIFNDLWMINFLKELKDDSN